MQEFDLNIEKVLDNWEVYHAIREIIANALDEQMLTKSREIEIYEDSLDGKWHIRDYGRGLKYTHFTQNENKEKLEAGNLIGKFGVGLKDALATFYRHHIDIEIDSKYGHYTIGQSEKHGFSDIKTLHAYIDEPKDKNMVGTDFIISGCSKEDISRAKNLFLKYSDLKQLDTTDYGEIYEKKDSVSEIFINGIKVAEEPNFLFSYNITALNASLKKAINRERTNVGRAAYTGRIKSILLSSEAKDVVDKFVDDLQKMSDGIQSDEIKWTDVQVHFVKILNKRDDVVFATPDQMNSLAGNLEEIVEESGKEVVFLPQNVLEKAKIDSDSGDNRLNTIESVIEEYNNSFEYQFVEEKDFTKSEKEIFSDCQEIINIINPDFDKKRVYILALPWWLRL